MTALPFPRGFLWGAATSSHQVEGGCTNNHWWAWEQEGGHVADGSVSGAACDHYRRFDDDFRLARSLGHGAQRISVEWSRVEPEAGRFDDTALDHYKAVVDSIRRHGMEPTVTLHHFTNPLWCQRAGGWENPEIVDWLARYAARTAAALGDRVQIWWTINEPMVAPIVGYVLGVHPPCVRDLPRALVVGRHTLLAHAKMYAAVHEAAAAAGIRVAVGVVHQMPYVEPFDPTSAADRDAAVTQDYFINGWYLDAIATGLVKPPFGGGEEVAGLRDSWDVIGCNYYARFLAAAGAEMQDPGAMRRRRPETVETLADEMGWEVHPPGLRNQLLRLAAYRRPLYVTENGMATLDDAARIRHLILHLAEVHRAIATGADVRGYFYWSLMDNFEWAEGYSKHFGLIAVDRATLDRTPRPAAGVYRQIIEANGISAALAEQVGIRVRT